MSEWFPYHFLVDTQVKNQSFFSFYLFIPKGMTNRKVSTARLQQQVWQSVWGKAKAGIIHPWMQRQNNSYGITIKNPTKNLQACCKLWITHYLSGCKREWWNPELLGEVFFLCGWQRVWRASFSLFAPNVMLFNVAISAREKESKF